MLDSDDSVDLALGTDIGSEQLAILNNTKASAVTARDFVQVDFAQFAGISVPYTVL